MAFAFKSCPLQVPSFTALLQKVTWRPAYVGVSDHCAGLINRECGRRLSRQAFIHWVKCPCMKWGVGWGGDIGVSRSLWRLSASDADSADELTASGLWPKAKVRLSVGLVSYCQFLLSDPGSRKATLVAGRRLISLLFLQGANMICYCTTPCYGKSKGHGFLAQFQKLNGRRKIPTFREVLKFAMW